MWCVTHILRFYCIHDNENLYASYTDGNLVNIKIKCVIYTQTHNWYDMVYKFTWILKRQENNIEFRSTNPQKMFVPLTKAHIMIQQQQLSKWQFNLRNHEPSCCCRERNVDFLCWSCQIIVSKKNIQQIE